MTSSSQHTLGNVTILEGLINIESIRDLNGQVEIVSSQYHLVDDGLHVVQQSSEELVRILRGNLAAIKRTRGEIQDNINLLKSENIRLNKEIHEYTVLRAELERAYQIKKVRPNRHVSLDDAPLSVVWSWINRFWKYVDVRDDKECWEWVRAKSTRYGVFVVQHMGQKRNIQAHRFSYMITKGPIPEGLVILHSCDNKRCVNPNHLSAGTDQDNVLEAIARGLIPGRPRLTSSEKFDVYTDRQDGMSWGHLAKKYKSAIRTLQKYVEEIENGSVTAQQHTEGEI